MKKHLLLISFILVMLLAISAVSASDSDNFAHDSVMPIASFDDNEQSFDSEVELTVDEQQNQADVLSEEGSNKNTPAVNVDTVTINEKDSPYIPFNITVAEGDIISGGVNVTIYGEGKSINKYIEVNNVIGQSDFSITDLVKLIELNKGCNISEIYNIIYSSVNFTDINVSEVISGLNNIYEGCNINIKDLIDGTEEVMDGTKINQEKLIEGINYILDGIIIDNDALIDGIKEILIGIDIDESNIIPDLLKYLNESGVNVSQVTDDFMTIINGFNVSSSDLDNILDAITVDKIKLGWGILDMIVVLDVKISYWDLINHIIKKDIPAILDDLAPILNINTIYKMLDPNFNRDRFIIALGLIIGSFNVDYDKISTSIIDIYNKFNFNISEIMDGLDKIYKEINLTASDFDKLLAKIIENNVYINSSIVSDSLDKIINAFIFNESKIYEGAAKVISSFSFNATAFHGLNKIIHVIDFNSSMIQTGVNKVVNGLGINISSIVSQLVAKFGYIVTFQNHLSPGIYNVIVEYIGEDGHVCAINDTAKLIVYLRNETPMNFDAVVDGRHVYITGSLNPNATGWVIFYINDIGFFDLVVNGKVTYDDIFEPGDYECGVIYSGDSNFDQNATAILFTVKSSTKIIASKVSTTYGNSKNIVVTLKDYVNKVVVGKKVTVKLNGKTYTQTTNAKGQISVAVPKNLKPKTYTASIAFAGDDKYVKSTGSVKMVVSKATPKIIAAKKTFKAATKTKKYTITLKANNKAMKNTKVTLKVNGKTYSAKTNSNGKATFKITKLTKKGTFKSAITYKGNNYYKKVTKKVNIVVK